LGDKNLRGTGEKFPDWTKAKAAWEV